ncbi:MAG TPA: glycosyltransferase [Selenomonadales bacterium]|nr:glycosyltransferase [Selenomonadales bacterium]
MLTSIIILTHNKLEITIQCLSSIFKHTLEPFELIVVDNGSTDGTVAYLKSRPDIKTVLNEKNLGFARGCNQGYEISTGDAVLFLNNDTIVTENWLGNMLRLLYSNDKIGLVGPVTNNVSGPQQIPVSYSDISVLDAFAKVHCKWNAQGYRSVLRLVGFCLLVKRTVLEDIGVFDERFGFGNFEDDDLCLRAANKGWQLMIALDSYIHHIGSVTFSHCEDTRTRNLLMENKQIAVAKWGFDIAAYLVNTNPPITISLCMIVQNAEDTLPHCLNSMKNLVDEIIIVDRASTDATKEIASRFTEKVYDFPFGEDRASARNFAFSKATMEYIFWLDADEILLEEDREKLFKLKKDLGQTIDAVAMNNHLGIGNYRLVKRIKRFTWFQAETEYLAAGGKVAKSDIVITSTGAAGTNRTLDNPLFPQELFEHATRLLEEGRRKKAISIYKKFLATGRGWIEDNILACNRIADSYACLNDRENELKYIYKSLEYDTMRAEVCCRLAFLFLNEKNYHHAAYWYKLATELEKPLDNYGLSPACWTWLPHLQLCICYDKLDKPELAYQHNERARVYIPNDAKVLHNKQYLEGILNKEKRPMTFVTLFPETENVHLGKDIGMIPYLLHKQYGLDARVACYENGEYPYISSLLEGLKLDFIPRNKENGLLDASEYLKANAKNIDILNLYHFLDRTLEWARLYKSLNPQGKIFLKLDANEWFIKQFDINENNIEASHSILKECALISVETTELYEYLNKQWPVTVEYLPNGFYDFGTRKQINFAEKENIICTVGRIGLYLKANEVLLEAFAIASPGIPDWKLKIIGPVEKQFESYIEQYFEKYPQLAEKVIFTGKISDKEALSAEYQKAKIFCLTSRLESFGLVFAEAASQGCFIITSDVVSAKDVTGNGKYGDIFRKDYTVQLADILIKNCQNEVRLARVCNTIQDFAYDNFYWVNICKKIYQHLIP